MSGRLSGDGDRLGQARDLEGHVHVERLADVDDDPFVVHLAEALELRGEVIDTHGKRRQPVDAFRIARLGSSQAGLRILRGDGDARDCRALRVHESAADVSGGLLREQGSSNR